MNREVLRIDDGQGGWKVRVIANKFPISDFHEVIVHSPDHDLDLPTISREQMSLVLTVYRQRFNYHVALKHGQVVIFYNHNVHAGASLEHSHSQLVVVPPRFRVTGLEKQPEVNVVFKTKHFSLYCPEFGQWPYELWAVPIVSGKTFGQISDEELSDLAGIIPKVSAVMVEKFLHHEELHKHPGQDDVPFNYYVYHGQDWFLRFIPRLIHPGGFELATGMNVNMIKPERAAEEYRKELARI